MIAVLATGFVLGSSPDAHAANDRVLALLDGSVALQIFQSGEERCFLEPSYFAEPALGALEKYCDLDIVPRKQTDSRYMITLNWGLARSYDAGGGSRRINLCYSPFVAQFGRNIDGRSIDDDTGDLRLFAEALFIAEAFVHQMTDQTRDVIYDALPERFTIYAKDLCGG